MPEKPEGAFPTMPYQYITFDRSEGVGLVTLNRPDALNALTPAMLQELSDVFRGMERDPLVRAIVLTGAGKAFCGGEDLRARAEAEFAASATPTPAQSANLPPSDRNQPAFDSFSAAFNPESANDGGLNFRPEPVSPANAPQPMLAGEFRPLNPNPSSSEISRSTFAPQPVSERNFVPETVNPNAPGNGNGNNNVAFGEQVRRLYNPFIKQLRQIEKPVIAAVNGVAAGTGLGLALACDMRLAAERARFIEVAVRVGLLPGSGTAFFLPRLIGVSKAMEILLNGDEINAAEAERLGLVSKVVPGDQLLDDARKLAGRLAKGPTRAIGMTKSLIYKTASASLDQALDLEAYLTDEATRTQDYKEGLRAYLDKRAPNYKGQ
jgi:2-(1,2-epoxy-1,2-dihydrophenyl)acetyl-CoA isomerase